MKKITIAQVIELVNKYKPNNHTDNEIKAWLNDVDEMIKDDIIDTHEGGEDFIFNGYDDNTPLSQELLLPERFGCDVYRYYIEWQIDIINKEIGKYNTSAALFHSAMQELELWWHRHYMPKQIASFHF